MTHSPNDLPTGSTTPQSAVPAPEQIKQVTAALQTLIGLIKPFHQLLEAQEKLDDGITNQLEKVMGTLATISINLQNSADSLVKLTQSETLSPALQAALEQVSTRQRETELRLAEIDKVVLTIRDWLNVPAPREQAAPSS